MSVYDPDAANLSAWGALVEKQSKGLKPDDFTWHTPRVSRSRPSTPQKI